MNTLKFTSLLTLLLLNFSPLSFAQQLERTTHGGGGHTSGGIVRIELPEDANAVARVKITDLINNHRQSFGLAKVTPEDVFAKKVILNGEVAIIYPQFDNIGEIKAFLAQNPVMAQTDQAFRNSNHPLSATWVLFYTLNELGGSSATIDAFLK